MWFFFCLTPQNFFNINMSHLLVKCCKIKTYARWFSSLNSVVTFSCKLHLLHVVSMNCHISHFWLCRLYIPSFEGIEYIIAVSWWKIWSMEVLFLCRTSLDWRSLWRQTKRSPDAVSMIPNRFESFVLNTVNTMSSSDTFLRFF